MAESESKQDSYYPKANRIPTIRIQTGDDDGYQTPIDSVFDSYAPGKTCPPAPKTRPFNRVSDDPVSPAMSCPSYSSSPAMAVLREISLFGSDSDSDEDDDCTSPGIPTENAFDVFAPTRRRCDYDDDDGYHTPQDCIIDSFAPGKTCPPAPKIRPFNRVSHDPDSPAMGSPSSGFEADFVPFVPPKTVLPDSDSDEDDDCSSPGIPTENAFDAFAPKRRLFDDDGYHTPEDCIIDSFAPGKTCPPAPFAKRTRFRR